LAEFPVTVVDKVVDKRGSRKIAEAYLNYLYAPEGQEILAQNFNRVHDKAVIEKHKDIYPDVRLVTVEDVFGGWDKLQKEHFAEGGVLDQLFTKK
jgi:sulfate transport system substrate-binding protein